MYRVNSYELKMIEAREYSSFMFSYSTGGFVGKGLKGNFIFHRETR